MGDLKVLFRIIAPETKTPIEKRLGNPTLYYSISGDSYVTLNPTKCYSVKNKNEHEIIVVFELKEKEIIYRKASYPASFKYYFQYNFDANEEKMADPTHPKSVLWQPNPQNVLLHN